MKRILVLTLCFAFAGIGTALAEVELSTHSVELGTEISHIKYKEPDVMEEKGVMFGIGGSYTYRNKLMLRADGKWSWGQVDYDGSLQDGTPYTIDDIDDVMLEFRGLGGWDFPILTATVLTPYTGFGYRYLKDEVDKDPAGYEREANYYYTPIGIETITELDNDWSLGLTFEYDYFWKGIQKSHLSDLHPSLNDVENDQEKGYGVRGSVKLQKKTEKVDLIIEPYIKYWNIKDSEMSAITYGGDYTGYLLNEPKNTSTEIGGKIAVRF